MSEPSIDEIVASIEWINLGQRRDIRALIASWRERGEALKDYEQWRGLWLWLNGACTKSAEEQADWFMESTLTGLLRGSDAIVRGNLVDQFKFAEARGAELAALKAAGEK